MNTRTHNKNNPNMFYNSQISKTNRKVIKINIRRFKWTTVLLLSGILIFSAFKFYYNPSQQKALGEDASSIASPEIDENSLRLLDFPETPENPMLSSDMRIGTPDPLLSNEFLMDLAISEDFDPGIFIFLRNYLLEELVPRYRSGSPFGIGNFLIREKSMNLYFKRGYKFDYTTPSGNAMAALLVLKHLKKYYKVGDLEASLIYLFGFSKVFSITRFSEVEKAKRYLSPKGEESGVPDASLTTN